MLQLQRREEILRLLKSEKELTVKEICAALYASPATVRRDLSALEQQGKVRRSFGGAVYNENFFDQQPLSVRGVKNVAVKQRLCAKAAQHLRPGETVFVDASSTTCFLAPYLKEIPELTVITNNPYLNVVLSELGVQNYSTGGKMLNASVALAGSDAERFVRGIRADACFFSARGVWEGNIYDSSKAERDVKLAMLEHSQRHYFLFDGSKSDRAFPYRIAGTDEMDGVITED